MSHLNLEELARLADEAPSALEQAHLHECSACRAELEQMRADVAALGALGEIAPPADAWDGLDARLRAEGLIRRDATGRRAWPVLLRLAAALALFLTGTLAGFAWRVAREPAPAVVATDAPPATEAMPAGRSAPDTPADTPSPDARLAGDVGAPADDARPRGEAAYAGGPEGGPGAPTLAADVQGARGMTDEPGDEPLPRIIGPASMDARLASLSDETPRTAEEAALLLRDAEGVYLEALARYAQLAGSGADAGDPLARLAALEGIVLTTREALGRAPADPVINGYHMTALAQREATLRQIAATTRNPWF